MDREQYLLTGDEEYEDVYDEYEFLAAQEVEEQEGAIIQTENGAKASVWLTEDETEIVLDLAEAHGVPPRDLIQEWVVERIKASTKQTT